VSERGGPSVKSVVLEYLAAEQPDIIGATELRALQRTVAGRVKRARPVSRRYLLEILSEAGAEIERSLGGLPKDLRGQIHFHDLEAAAASLSAMAREYQAAHKSGNRVRAEDCRRAVRQAKERLRMVLRRAGSAAGKQAEKQAVLEWMLIWLEAPTLFESWLRARRRSQEQRVPAAESAKD
jgi:hypothetical protein